MTNDGRVTLVLVYSVAIALFGSFFLQGYHLGVLRMSVEVLQEFYRKAYYEREGGSWENLKEYEHYSYNHYFQHLTSNEDHDRYSDFNKSLNQKSYYGYHLARHFNDTHNPSEFAMNPPLWLKPRMITILWIITVVAYCLFAFIGYLGSAKVADCCGRKRGMLMTTSLMFVAALLGGVSLPTASPECLMVSMAFSGLHAGLNTSLCLLYVIEICPKKTRGAGGTSHQIAMALGYLTGVYLAREDVLGTESSWPWLFVLEAIPALICLALLPLFPESPRFLFIQKGEEEEARKALIVFRGTTDVSEEIDEMRLEASRSVGVKNYTIKQLLTTPDLRKPVIIGCLLQIFLQWSGITAVMSYSTMMFLQANIEWNVFPYIWLAYGIVQVLSTVVAMPLMEKVGRRPLLTVSMIGMFVSQLIMMIFLNFSRKADLADYHVSFAYVCIISMYIYITSCALGIGPISTILAMEMFRQKARAVAFGLSMAVGSVCGLIVALTFPFIQDALNEFVYLLFCAILALAIVFTFFFVPETRNKTFDEIADSLSTGRRAGGKENTYSVKDDECKLMSTSGV